MCKCYYINEEGKYVDCYTGEIFNFIKPPKNSLIFNSYKQFLDSSASINSEKEKPRKKFFVENNN